MERLISVCDRLGAINAGDKFVAAVVVQRSSASLSPNLIPRARGRRLFFMMEDARVSGTGPSSLASAASHSILVP